MITLLDFETTGLDTESCRIIEIGAIRVGKDWEEQDRLSLLVQGPEYPELTPEIAGLTGITQEDLDREGIPPKDALVQLEEFMSHSPYATAYNAGFDRAVLEAEMRRALGTAPHEFDWFCSMADVPWPKSVRGRPLKLMYLALELGLTVDPKKLHRAVNDLELTLECLRHGEGGPYTLERILDYAQDPWVYVAIEIPPPWTDNGVGKAYASSKGYRWEKPAINCPFSFTKMWVKRIKKADFEEYKGAECAYPRKVVFQDDWQPPYPPYLNRT